VDLILIGPKGIWVFDIRHWDGKVFWDDDGWRRELDTKNGRGMDTVIPLIADKTPDQMWIRSAAQVTRNLQTYAAETLERYPAFEQVLGGIVFSNEEALLKVQPGRPVFWGTPGFWIKTLNEVEPKANLENRSALHLVEILLERHHELTSIGQQRSMKAYAQSVIHDAEAQLKEWTQR